MNEHIAALKTYPLLTELLNLPVKVKVGPLRVVLDTNVLLDWIYWENPVVLSLMEKLKAKEASLLYSKAILEEVVDVLARESFEIPLSKQQKALETIASDFCRLDPEQKAPSRCKDPDDQKFLDLTYAAKASMLVTRDKKVLKAGKKLARFNQYVVTPQEALERLK